MGRQERRKISGSAGRCTASGSRGDMLARGGNGVRGSSPKAHLRQPTLEYANAVNVAGSLAWHQTDFPAARTLLEQGLALSKALDDRCGLARTLNSLGNLAIEQGDYPAAQSLYQESLALCRELGIVVARPPCSAIWRWSLMSAATLSLRGHCRKSCSRCREGGRSRACRTRIEHAGKRRMRSGRSRHGAGAQSGGSRHRPRVGRP